MRVVILLLSICVLVFSHETKLLPTGFSIDQSFIKKMQVYPLNPHLKNYPDYVAGQAVSIKISPDKSKVAILTSGYNLLYNKKGNLDKNNSTEYIFIYNITSLKPKELQVIKVPNSFYGLVWHPIENSFYVSGGKDDVVYKYDYINKKYQLTQTIKLSHKHSIIKKVQPMVAELAISTDGKLLAVTNMENDSVSLVSTAKSKVIDEIDLRPHTKNINISGGTYPFGIVITKNNFVYVSSMRDNEIIKLHIKNDRFNILKHIKVGSQPTRLAYNSRYNELYICESRSDTVRVIDVENDKVKTIFHTLAPKKYFTNKGDFKGANPNGISISEDGNKLYITNGGTNSLACFTLKHKKNTIEANFDALIPTLWYPNDILTYNGKLYIINGKSLSGPNIDACRKSSLLKMDVNKKCKSANEYVWQTKNASLQIINTPKKEQYKANTLEVLKNNHMISSTQSKKNLNIMKFLQEHIKHIIYVVKENRTYDQVLGDLKTANGDSDLTLFHEDVAPNHYAIARNFVALDNTMASGSCSGDGWVWSTAAHTTEYVEKMMPMLYARRGFSYDVEGHNRNIPVGLDTLKLRDDNTPQMKKENMMLKGDADVAAPDGPNEEAGAGYLWDSALRKGLSLRNYGFFCNNSRYFLDKNDTNYLIPYKDSYAHHYRQSYPNKKALLDISDPYFRGFDMAYPDLWRFEEFKREYDNFTKKKKMPTLMMVRLPHDHFGGFKQALAKVNTPKRQMADNDYALGLLVQTVAKSPYKDSTLIFVIEDDAQNGADHVSAQRTLAFVVGPYVKQHETISTHYSTVNMLKTIEAILSFKPLSVNDKNAQAMYDVFDIKQKRWNYSALIPDILYATDLKIPKHKGTISLKPEHSSDYWAKVMKKQNFNDEDKLDTDSFNKALWEGIHGSKF